MVAFNFDSLTTTICDWLITIFAIHPLQETTSLAAAYKVFILMMILFTFTIQMYSRIITKFQAVVEVTYITIISSTINTIIDVACNVVMTLPSLYLDEDFKENIRADINAVDIILMKYSQNNSGTNHIHIKLLLLTNLVLLVAIGHTLSFWILDDDGSITSQYLYYNIDQFYRYRITILVAYIYYILNKFHGKIVSINAILTENFGRYCNPNLPTSSPQMTYLRGVARDMSKVHAKFTQLICDFNKVFGWQILLILFNYTSLFMIDYEIGLRIVLSKLEDPHYRYSFWVYSNMIYTMVQTGIFARISSL